MQLVKENIRPRDLPEFFWHHLERDVELLGRSIGRSMDESAITIHLVIREILQRNPPTCEELMVDGFQSNFNQSDDFHYHAWNREATATY